MCFYLVCKQVFINRAVTLKTAGKQHEVKALAVNFLSILETKTTRCPMNEDRSPRLSHFAVQKNNPGFSSNEEKSDVSTLFQQMFSQWERSAKTAVAACFFSSYTFAVFFILIYPVMTDNKTSHMVKEITNRPQKCFCHWITGSLSGCFVLLLNLHVQFYFKEVPNNKVNISRRAPNKIK